MAIFTAGCIETTNNSSEIRNSVYELARHDLDSPAMKISVRKSPTCINFIAFLPKDKIIQENILKKVSECESRTVIVFELDYKYVGVVCEYRRIIDYILDKPKEFAQERGYETVFVDNADGVKLVSFNLDENNRRAKAGFISLGFTILLTTTIFYSGFYYMQDTQINKGNKDSLEKQYKNIVKNEFKKSEKIIKKVDMVEAIEGIEKLTKATESRLSQITYSKNNICVKIETPQVETFVGMLPKNIKINHKDIIKGEVQYCYETI
ncbi:MAG: hypothetical protein OQK48_08780 [Sulfurimonas sp.]|uniref:hypothetical protein n=1 Tax=Sulfurimonas sp. TaxID=2022749 RepID=UPI0026196A1B|nr:hypothetical protein [Sulfurimonas sp.]MCW8894798.1 hypothetical protein [Sulfurimonas sp.]MCW8955017.1 hypothetical protein [Sulfurimonas sp.]MCW9067664.1 hypothetical protein [Sulfurimonas sp.]